MIFFTHRFFSVVKLSSLIWWGFGVSSVLAAVFLSAQVPASVTNSAIGLIYYTDRIIPTPKSVDYGPWLRFDMSEMERPFQLHILLGESPHSLDWKSVETIKAQLASLNLSRPMSVTVGRVDELFGRAAAADLAIHIGRVQSHSVIERFSQRYEKPRSERPEGYRIASLRADAVGPATLFLIGNDPRGTYYAAQSLIQMLTVRNGYFAVRELEVVDWPSYAIRASGNDEKIPAAPVPEEALAWLAHVKLNAWAVGQSYHWPINWRETPKDLLNALRRAVAQVHPGAIDLQFQIHPFGRASEEGDRNKISIADDEDRQRLIQFALDRIRAGANQILLRADDFHELSKVDLRTYASKADAHISLIRELYQAMAEQYPFAQLIFCPPYYHGDAATGDTEIRSYLETIGRELPPEIIILWTGQEVVSKKISLMELDQFSVLVEREPMLWDNTVFREKSDFGYPYIYAWYMYQPISLDVPSNFPQLVPGIRFNYGFDGSQMSRVANVLLAEFLWNPEAYDKDRSLRQAIALVAGTEAVDTVLTCAQAIRNVFDLRHSPARTAVYPVITETSQFQAWMKQLGLETDNRALIDELLDAWHAQASHADKLRQLSMQFEFLKSQSLAVLSYDPSIWSVKTNGAWRARIEDELASFSFPFETESTAGAHAAVSANLAVPRSPTGRYYLCFVADDDYYATGEPPAAYPGYFYKQLLVNGEVVWQADAVGPTEPNMIQIDLTDQLAGSSHARVIIRCVDALGVSNLGVNVTFSPLYLSANPVSNGSVIVPGNLLSGGAAMEVAALK